MEPFSGMAVFVKVAEARSLSMAARQLGLTPSAVSKTLAKLEARLSVQLLHRTTRQVGLTAEGRGFYERCKRILAEVREAELSLTNARDVPRGRVRLAAAVAIGRVSLVPRLPELLSTYPELAVELTLRDDYVDPIAEGLDVVVHWVRLSESPLIQKKLTSSRLRVFASPEYLQRAGVPRTPEALDKHECLFQMHDGRPLEWRFRRGSQEIIVPVNGRFTVNSVDALRDMAVAGVGLMRIYDLTVAPELEKGQLVPVLDEFCQEERTLFALYPPATTLSPRVRVVVDWLAQVFGSSAK